MTTYADITKLNIKTSEIEAGVRKGQQLRKALTSPPTSSIRLAPLAVLPN